MFGEFVCETVSFLQVQAVMMNAFCLFSIALERYLSVIRSLKAPVLSPDWEKRLPYIALACIWIIPTGMHNLHYYCLKAIPYSRNEYDFPHLSLQTLFSTFIINI